MKGKSTTEDARRADLEAETARAQTEYDQLLAQRLAFIWPFCFVRGLNENSDGPYVPGALLAVEAVELNDERFKAACNRYLRATYDQFALEEWRRRAFRGLGRVDKPMDIMRADRYDAQRLFIAWADSSSAIIERRCGRQIQAANEGLDRAVKARESIKDEYNLIEEVRAFLRETAEKITDEQIDRLSKDVKLQEQEAKRRQFRSYSRMVEKAGPFAVVVSYYFAKAYHMRSEGQKRDKSPWEDGPAISTPDDVRRVLGIVAQSYSQNTIEEDKKLGLSVTFYQDRLERCQSILRKLYYEQSLEDHALELLEADSIDAELRSNLQLKPSAEERALLQDAHQMRLEGRSADAEKLEKQAGVLRGRRNEANDKQLRINRAQYEERLQKRTAETQAEKEEAKARIRLRRATELRPDAGEVPDARGLELEPTKEERAVADEQEKGVYARKLARGVVVLRGVRKTRSGRTSRLPDLYGESMEVDVNPEGVEEEEDADYADAPQPMDEGGFLSSYEGGDSDVDASEEGKGADRSLAPTKRDKAFVVDDDEQVEVFVGPQEGPEMLEQRLLRNTRQNADRRTREAEILMEELGVDLPTALAILDDRAKERILAAEKKEDKRNVEDKYWEYYGSGSESDPESEGEPELKRQNTATNACIQCGVQTLVKPLHGKHMAAICNAECRAAWVASLVPLKKEK